MSDPSTRKTSPGPGFDSISNFDSPGDRPLLRAALLALAAALTSFAGCDGHSPDRLLVATSWPAIDRHRLESEFQSWVAASHIHLEHRRIRLEWLILEPGDDLVRLVERREKPDVLLGGNASSFARLARTDLLASTDPAGSAILAVQSRGDPISLAWAMSQLDHGHWREGYAALVREAGSGPRVSLSAGRAVDANLRGEREPGGTGLEPPFPPRRIEWVAIPRTARNQDTARGFLRFLAETQPVVIDPGPAEIQAGVDPDAESMVADLLRATLVDAQDELWAAWASLKRAGYPEPALQWLTEPPPWPPASVAKYLRRDGETGMSLIQTLAAELAPEPAARAWLLRSWLAPARTVDEQLLGELAHAEQGLLGHEPRFRAWLREEWTAWSRQRYRRVARRIATDPGAAPK